MSTQGQTAVHIEVGGRILDQPRINTDFSRNSQIACTNRLRFCKEHILWKIVGSSGLNVGVGNSRGKNVPTIVIEGAVESTE